MLARRVGVTGCAGIICGNNHRGGQQNGELRHEQHPYGRACRPGGIRQDHARRGAAARVRRRQGGRHGRARHDGQRFRSAGEDVATLAARVDSAPRHAGHARPPDRHARLPRFHRAGDRCARRRGDGGGGGERAVGHRDDRVADDGLVGEAPALPPRRRQQDRRGERRPARSPGVDPGHVRQGMPADQSAGRRRQPRRRLLLQPRRASPTSRPSDRRIARWSIRSSRSTRS